MILSSANALNLVKAKILSFGKELKAFADGRGNLVQMMIAVIDMKESVVVQRPTKTNRQGKNYMPLPSIRVGA